MDFHTGTEVLLSVLYSVLFGAFGGLLKTSISVAFQYIETVIRLPLSVAHSTENRASFKASFRKGVNIICSKNKIKEFFSDFIFTLIYGILFSLLTYVSVDGVFRLYILIVSVAVTYVSFKTLGSLFEKFSLAVLRLICTVSVNAIIIFVYPMRMFANKITKCISKITKRIQCLDKQDASC